MPPTVLLLDVMGTLVHDPFFEEMPAFFGLTFEELLAHKHPSAWLRFERGALSEEAFLERFFADGRAFDRPAFVRAVAESYRFLPGIEPLLKELKAAGVAMHALSNYPIWYRRIEARLGLSRFLSLRFFSCETGARKPEPEAYEGALRALGVAPEQALFVDDRAANCEAAAALGMRAHRFTSAASLRAALCEQGLLERGLLEGGLDG